MQEYITALNDEQRDVVLHGDGACLVLAGAGSGKTRTIITRVAYMLDQGVNPEEILLVTFTNKAAKEMLERVAQLTGRPPLPWAGTFHHIGYRLLRKYGALLGYSSQTAVMDSDDALSLMKLCVKSIVPEGGKKFPSAQVLLSLVSFAKNASQDIATVVTDKYAQFEYALDQIAAVRDAYERKKRESNVWDFDDLLIKTVELLHARPEIANKLSSQFRFVLVDEFQDTNTVQATLLRQLSATHKNILAVGDDAQSIYSFRAANIENILGFEKQFVGAKVFRLTKNYRSTPEILSLANCVIAHNVHQYEKHLQSVQESFVKPVLTISADQAEEAEQIVERVEALFGEGIARKDIAVLFRSSHHSQAVEIALNKRRIAYEYRGGMRFFERAHIKDVLAFLRVIANPQDAICWQRILLMQAGIGPAAVEQIIAMVRSVLPAEHPVLSEQILRQVGDGVPMRAKAGYNRIFAILLHMLTGEQEPSVLIFSLLETWYSEYLAAEYPDARERGKDIEQLAVLSKKTVSLTEFLSETSLQEGFQRTGEQDNTKEKIILSTIHQAKGLEWDSVFILHLSQGEFPSDRSLRERRGIEEERRLLYVALTRARKRLFVSYALVNGFGSFGGPSMFLDEIEPALLDIAQDNAGTAFLGEHDGLTYVSEDTEWQQKKTSFLKSIDEL